MDAVLKWAGIVGAAWLAVSILAAIGWALIGKRIFRNPPAPPRLVRRDGEPISQREADAVRSIMKLDAELRGGDTRGGA